MAETKPRHLSPEPARMLTSREVAKVLGGLLGSMVVDQAKPEDIKAAVLESILKMRRDAQV